MATKPTQWWCRLNAQYFQQDEKTSCSDDEGWLTVPSILGIGKCKSWMDSMIDQNDHNAELIVDFDDDYENGEVTAADFGLIICNGIRRARLRIP
ncbi:MAG: hypothetical protein LBV04_04405 [Deferribacteraceae bacterium]|nr:hypothetical protein [Deferribacteraceae bacterium]